MQSFVKCFRSSALGMCLLWTDVAIGQADAAESPPPATPAAAALSTVLVDVAGKEVRVLAPQYKLIAGGDGVRFEPYRGGRGAPAPLTFRLAAVRRGASVLPLREAAPPELLREAMRIDHGSVHEHWLWRTGVAEQRFLVPTHPGDGDLVITLAVATDLHCVDVEPGVAFCRDDRALVHYGDVTTIDAMGRRVTTATRVVDGGLELVVPAAFCADATWPLLVDPIVAPLAVDTGSDDVRNPEVAFEPGVQRWLVVYERHQSSLDIDIIARRYTREGVLLEEVGVAIGSRESRNPTVAANTSANQFCVVWDEDRLFDRVVLGRLRNAFDTTQGAEFVIRDANGDSNQNPAIGGSIATDADNDRYLIVSERGAASMDYTVVSTTGTVVQTSTRSQTQQRRPRINKARATGEAWVIASEANGDILVEAGPVNGLGALQSAPLPEFERQPAVAGRNGMFALTWVSEDPFTNKGRLFGRVLRLNGNVLTVGVAPLNLRTNEPGGSLSRDQSIPALSYDGRRFTVAYRERQTSGIDQPFAAVFGFDNPFATSVTFHDGHVALSSVTTPHGALAMASEGDMGLESVRSLIVFDRVAAGGDRDVLAVRFDGKQPGDEITVEPTGCGGAAAPQYATLGSTALGSSVTLQMAGPGVPLWLLGEPIGASPPLVLCQGTTGSCRLGVALPLFGLSASSTFSVQMPILPSFVGSQLAAQGVMLGASGGCDASLLGQPFTVGDTLVLTVR